MPDFSPKKINPDQVRALAAIGCTHSEIAAVLGCSTKTIARKHVDSVKKGQECMKASLRRFQYEAAAGGNPTMLIWMGKQFLDQTDVAKVQHTGDSHSYEMQTDAEIRKRIKLLLTENGEELRAILRDVGIAPTNGRAEKAHSMEN